MIQKQPTKTAATPKSAGPNRPEDSVLLRLEKARLGADSYVLGISSCHRRAGVSTVAGNLAVRAARLRLGRILLIDCNTDHPRQAKNFAIKQPAGLAQVIGGEAQAEEVIVNGKVDDLHVLIAGKAALPTVIPEQLENLMKSLREHYDLILLDLPPVSDDFGSVLFQRVVDGVVLVSDQTARARDTRNALRILKEGNVEVVGIILNRVRRTLPRWLDRLF